MGPSTDILTLDVEVRRGSILESRHRLQAAVCDPEGRLVAGTAGCGLVTTMRSAAKPFQALPLVERGHAEQWGFSDEQLAIMCGSHTGSPTHVALVEGILERIGLEVRHFACGYHDPLDPVSLALVQAQPERRTAIYNNCSGKHAGLLAQCVAEGWPVEGYERIDHPLQKLVRATIAELCGVVSEDIEVAVDGCHLCVFALPLTGMARGFARLAAARASGGPRDRALARLRDAMTSFPAAVGGAGRFSTALMEATGGRVVSKAGAEGLECVGVLAPGLGLAVKCEDGQARAVAPAVIALLDHLGVLSEEDSVRLIRERRPVILNTARAEVGVIEAVVRSAATTRR